MNTALPSNGAHFTTATFGLLMIFLLQINGDF
jgi:hypothetical protein